MPTAIEPERGFCVVLDATVKPTVPLPVPEAPLVIVTNSGLSLVAVQVHVFGLACTWNVLDAPFGSA